MTSDSLTLPPQMRAWTYTTRGTPRQVLSLSRTFPTPSPPSGANLLIRISHAALNPSMLALLSLGITPLLHNASTTPACIPELDFSGTVVLAGPAAPAHLNRAGTRVFGTMPMQSWAALRSGAGTLAEFVLLGSDAVALLPANLALAEAAALSACGQTALKMCQLGAIKPGLGQRVLVNGGSGGVGSLVCQIARAMGAEEVVATCSGANVDMVSGLGVDEVSCLVFAAPFYSPRSREGNADTSLVCFLQGDRLSCHGSFA